MHTKIHKKENDRRPLFNGVLVRLIIVFKRENGRFLFRKTSVKKAYVFQKEFSPLQELTKKANVKAPRWHILEELQQLPFSIFSLAGGSSIF
jgi:hypothetical protein